MITLKGKTCLVTAAAQGIGLATAKAFADAGGKVIATDINTDPLKDIKEFEAHRLDVTDPQAIIDFAEQTGDIDVLFNCAGFVHAGSVLDCTEEEWQFAFDLNVRSMYRLIKAYLPGMVKKRSGSIVNMASVASSLKGVPNRFIYSASKAAIIGLTKSVAADFVGDGVRCNAICPGTVDSPSLHDRLKATGDYDKAMKDFVARQPMGRLGKAEEIASLATYLASDAAAFTTGQTHIVDGGWAL